MNALKLSLLCLLILYGSCMYGMEQEGKQSANPSLIKVFVDNLGSRSRNQNIDSWIEQGDPENLDKDLMEISLKCCPTEVSTIINGLKDPANKELYPHELLFTGPSGTGKTTLALAISYSLNVPYRLIETIQLSNEYKDSCAQNLWRAVEPVLQDNKPCVVILDEITALTRDHIQEKTDGWKSAMSLWKLLDKLKKYPDIIFIGTTNDASQMPSALKSRFSDSVFEIPTPTINSRIIAITHFIKKFKITMADDAIKGYAQKTDKVSLRDLEKLTLKTLRIAFESQKEKTKIRAMNLDHVALALKQWNYANDTLLKINEPQLTMQERLQKENHEFLAKENEQSRKQQEAFHDQQIVANAVSSYWSHYVEVDGRKGQTATQYLKMLVGSFFTPNQKKLNPFK